MYKKLQIQVALFCTLVTSGIMIAMSTFIVLSAQSTLRENEEATFVNDVNAMVATIENMEFLSYEWLARMEREGHYIVSVFDSGNPLLYEQLVHTYERQEVVEKARKIAYHEHELTQPNHTTITRYQFFALTLENGEEFSVSAIFIPRHTGFLEVYIIYSLSSLNLQILNQWLTFTVFNFIGVGLLGTFSYFLTKRMIQPLIKSHEKQTDFIASASHELRTPLTVIQNSVSALSKANKKEALRFHVAIDSECKRMSHLIRDLLTLTTSDNYSFSVNMKEVEIDTLALDVYEKFELLASDKKINLTVDLPPIKTPRIKGDPIRLTQVLAILLDNAISYSPPNSKVNLSLSLSKMKMHIVVTDNGIGIPDDLKERIWERFYRGEVSRSDKKHFGLGLPIAKEIVNQHKGTISVSDNPSGGAVFTISIPI